MFIYASVVKDGVPFIDPISVQDPSPQSSRYRACAGPERECAPQWFSLNLPEGNLFGIGAGRYAPAVADGYYLLLRPLPPGEYTIRFGGIGNLGVRFTQATIYKFRIS